MASQSSEALVRDQSHSKRGMSRITDLCSLDDPELWYPPDGPIVEPPGHIDAIIRKRKLWSKRDEVLKTDLPVLEYDGPGRPLAAADSEFNLRKDFFKLRHPKNLHHSEKIYTFSREHRAERHEGGAVKFMHGKDTGWFQLKRIFNPEVFECMADYIIPIENFEFYAAFEVFLSCLHNSELVMRVTSKEDLVEIWSRNFARKLQDIINLRPSTFHTIVIPLILKPIEKDRAVTLISKEWKKSSLFSCLFPAASIYARCVNRWILPLTEAFEEGPNGTLKKPEKRTVRLDLGYLFHQRRLAGRKSNTHVADESEGKSASVGQYYHVVHRSRPGRRLSEHKKFLVPFGHSSINKLRNSGSHKLSASSQKRSASSAKQSASQRPTMDLRGTIASQRGTLRTSAVPGNQSMISVRRPKFDLDRLLKANHKKSALERVYWLQPMRAGRHQPPKKFAKLINLNQTDDERVLTEMRSEFLNDYLPFACREKYKEPQKDPSLIYPQYDSRTIRGMLHDEIVAEMSDAKNRIRYGKAQVREIRRPIVERKKRLKAALAEMEQKLGGVLPGTGIQPNRADPSLDLSGTNKERRKDYLHALDKEIVMSEPEISEDEDGDAKSFKKTKVQQLVGDDTLDILKHWPILSNELANSKGPIIPPPPAATTADRKSSEVAVNVEIKQIGGLALPQPQNQLIAIHVADSFVTTSISAEKVEKVEEARLTTRQLLLDTDKDPAEEHSLFLRLVIDSGHNYFYFDIGGDSDGEDEAQEAHPVDVLAGESQDLIDAGRRRRQSSLAVEAMNKWNFNYLDRGGLKEVAATFEHLKGAEQDEKKWEAAEQRSIVEELMTATEMGGYPEIPVETPAVQVPPDISIVHEVEVPESAVTVPPVALKSVSHVKMETTSKTILPADSKIFRPPLSSKSGLLAQSTDQLVQPSSSALLAKSKGELSAASQSGLSLGFSVSSLDDRVPSREQFSTSVANEPIVDAFKPSQLSVNVSATESAIHRNGVFGPGTGFRTELETTPSDGPAHFLRQLEGTDAHPLTPRRDFHTVPYCFVCKRRIDPNERHVHDNAQDIHHRQHEKKHHHHHRDHGFFFPPETPDPS